MSPQNAPAPQSTADAVRLVAAAIAGSDFQLALEIADVALAQGFIHPALYNARALWLERQNRNEDALTEFQRARALAPEDWALLNAIGLCLTRLDRLDQALEAFDQAIRINPSYAPSHQRKGVALGMVGQSKLAEVAYRRAVSLDPTNAEACASLAASLARKRDFAAAQVHAERALARDRSNATAHAALALVELERGEFNAAEKRLRPLLDSSQLIGRGRAVVLGLLGDALDGENRCAEAFDFYQSANLELRKLQASRFETSRSLTELLDQLAGWVSAAPDDAWQAEEHPPPQPVRSHVFLLGFYRCRTALLEQVLRRHPDIITLDERDPLAAAAQRYLTTPEGVQRLAGIGGPELESERADYWQRVREAGAHCEGKVFVDRHPLNAAKLPLIRKLFPAAKILFSIRDPRDVVLSCFRRPLEINSITYQLLTLEGAARLYDSTIGFAELCRKAMPFSTLEQRYEALVADFDAQMRAVCEFLELPFTENMRDFDEASRRLHDTGIGKWRCYEMQLAPVLTLLTPWAKRFGYAVP